MRNFSTHSLGPGRSATGFPWSLLDQAEEKEDTKMNKEELVTTKINNKGEMDDIKWIGW